jgi:hypothetical protein
MWLTDPEYGLSPKNTIGIDVYNPPPVSYLLPRATTIRVPLIYLLSINCR